MESTRIFLFYIRRDANRGVILEWKAQLLKNQNMPSAAHLSSSKCPDFGIHYNGNCSGKITLSKMSSTRHPRHACRLAQFHDHWEAEIKAFMWEKIGAEIDIKHLLGDITLNCREGASFWGHIFTNQFKVKLYTFFSPQLMFWHEDRTYEWRDSFF